MKLRYKLLILVALSVGVHALTVARTLIVSRDSVRFIRVAQLMSEPGLWRYALTSEVQHPLYPAAILGTHSLVGPLVGGNTPEGWALSGQITSVLFAVLATVLLFLVARHLVGEPAAWIGVLLYVFLPQKTEIGADALSDMCRLFWSLLALWAALRGMRNRNLGWIALAGAAAALAYLTRPEGIVVGLVALSGVLWPNGLAKAHGARWRLVAGGVLAAVMLAMSVPYMVVIDDFSHKFQHELSGQYWFPASSAPASVPTTDPISYAPVPGQKDAEQGGASVATPGNRAPWAAATLTAPLPFGATFDFEDVTWRQVLVGMREFVRDYARTLHFALVPFFLVGVWLVVRGKTRVVPIRTQTLRFVGVYMLVQVAIGITLPVLAQYLDRRHLVPLFSLSTLFSGIGLVEAMAWLESRFGRRPVAWPTWRWLAVPVALFALLGLLESGGRLHASKGHKLRSGLYLREHAGPDDRVVANSIWIGYYADRPFLQCVGPGLDINKYQMPQFLVAAQADWLALMIRYDELPEQENGRREYERLVLNARPRLVHQVPVHHIELDRLVTDVAIPDHVQQALDGSVWWRELIRTRRFELVPTYLGPPRETLDPWADDLDLAATGDAVTDALSWLARHPGVRGLIYASDADELNRVRDRIDSLLTASPKLAEAVVRRDEGWWAPGEADALSLKFANGSELLCWAHPVLEGVHNTPAGTVVGAVEIESPSSVERLWVPSGLAISPDDMIGLNSMAVMDAPIRLYYRPERGVYIFRIDHAGLKRYLSGETDQGGVRE